MADSAISDYMSWPVVAVLGAFAISLGIAYYLTRPGARIRILDEPNERSLHERATPRTGGLAIIPGILASGVILAVGIGGRGMLVWGAVPLLILAAVALVDDWREVPVSIRLVVQAIAGIALVAAGLAIESVRLPGFSWQWPWLAGAAFSVIYVVWAINLYNFMDGMDGFAGGMAVIGFAALGLIGWRAEDLLFAGLAWSIAGSAMGFLVWNFPPAQIFLGDSGSTSLGFLAAVLTMWADRLAIAPLWISILIFSPFVVDATVTLLRRLWRGERVWQAHRKHYYQRLARSSWGYRATVLSEYIVMVACAITAIVVVDASPNIQWAAVFGWIMAYAVILLMIDRKAPFSPGEVR